MTISRILDSREDTIYNTRRMKVMENIWRGGTVPRSSKPPSESVTSSNNVQGRPEIQKRMNVDLRAREPISTTHHRSSI